MPYSIRKYKKGYRVVTKTTGKAHSKKPMTMAQARKQLIALHIHTKE